VKASSNILIELYRKRDYSQLGLFQKQYDTISILENYTVNEVLFGGAARGGKSVLGCTWKIMRRLSMPESFGLIAREEYSKLRDTTILTYFKTLKLLGLERDVDYKATGVPLTVEFLTTGSREFFRDISFLPSDPEFDRLGSYDLTDAFIDEAQQVHYKAIQVLKGRFSVVEGNGWQTIPKALYTCNPAKTWVYGDFVLPSSTNRLEQRKCFVKSLPKDNPYIPQSFFDNLETADEVTKQRLLYGNFEYDDDPRALVDYTALCDIFTNEHVSQGSKIISADLAMQGRDRFIAGYWSGNICKIAIDKKKSDGKEIETDLRALKIEQSISNSGIVADSDGLGNYLESYIKGIYQFRGGARAYNTKDFNDIKSECAWLLASLINQRDIYIVCSKEQQEIIKKELSTCLKKDNVDSDGKNKLISKIEMKKNLGHSPDYLDMLIMGMIFKIMPKRKGQSIL
jgi:phage terminase large subunit